MDLIQLRHQYLCLFFFLALFDTQVFSAAPPIGDYHPLCCRYRNTSTLLTTATCRCRPSPAARRAAPAPAPRLPMTSWSVWLPMSRSMSARTLTRLRLPSKPSIIWWLLNRIMVSELDFCNYAFLPQVVSSVTSPRGYLGQGKGRGRGMPCSEYPSECPCNCSWSSHLVHHTCSVPLVLLARIFESKAMINFTWEKSSLYLW